MFQKLESVYLWGVGLFQSMTLLNTHFYFLCCWKSPGFVQDDIVPIKCRQWLMMNLNQLWTSVSICCAAMDGPGIQAWQMRHKKQLICNVSLQKGAFVKTENGIGSTDTIWPHFTPWNQIWCLVTEAAIVITKQKSRQREKSGKTKDGKIDRSPLLSNETTRTIAHSRLLDI